MEGDNDKVRRISIDQRELMLDFMKRHPSLATGKFTAPDGAKHKQRLLNELANELNSVSNGVTKSPDKWLKSWQDWRSDTKAKAALFKRESNKTGGGKINPKAKALTPLEEQLLGFLGPNLVGGHEEVMDPLLAAVNGNGHGARQLEGEGVVPPHDIFIMPLDGPPTSPSVSVSSEAPTPEESNPSSPGISEPSSKRQKANSLSEGGSECGSSTSSSKKHTALRRRRKDSSLSEMEIEDSDAKLVKLSESQVDIAREDLKLKERQTVALEQSVTAFNGVAEALTGAAHAFAGAMRAMEQYFKNKSDDFLS